MKKILITLIITTIAFTGVNYLTEKISANSLKDIIIKQALDKATDKFTDNDLVKETTTSLKLFSDQKKDSLETEPGILDTLENYTGFEKEAEILKQKINQDVEQGHITTQQKQKILQKGQEMVLKNLDVIGLTPQEKIERAKSLKLEMEEFIDQEGLNNYAGKNKELLLKGMDILREELK